MSRKRSGRPEWDHLPHGSKKPRGANEPRHQAGHTTGKNNKVSLYVRRGNVDPGDIGVWASCARGQEHKAARELQLLFDEYAEKMYGIKQEENTWVDNSYDPEVGPPKVHYMGNREDEAKGERKKGELLVTVGEARQSNAQEDDIESLLNKEIEAIKDKTSSGQSWFTSATSVFAPVRFNVECLIFIRTRPPVRPVEMVNRICQDAMDAANRAANDNHGSTETFSNIMFTRYVNRLTPITVSARSNEQGVIEVSQKVLPEFFKMAGGNTSSEDKAEDGVTEEEKPAYSYAIRPSIRHHDVLKRLEVIQKIASLIDREHHKVDLANPDKYILVEIFRTTIGMSVVDKNWVDLKRYNMTEIINLPVKSNQKPAEGNAENMSNKGTKEAAEGTPDTEKPGRVEETAKMEGPLEEQDKKEVILKESQKGEVTEEDNKKGGTMEGASKEDDTELGKKV